MTAVETAPAELETIALRWQFALDAASGALSAAADSLPPVEVSVQRQALARERQEIAVLLRQVAAAVGASPRPWLPAGPVWPSMLGLEPTAKACLFDLDGVLTDSDLLHAAAWSEALDPLLVSVEHERAWRLEPFDRDRDYDLYFDGRPRREGIRLFLESRGLHLPEGAPSDPSSAPTVYGIARRKGELLEGRLAHGGVAALVDARRYLQAAGYAHLGRAVVSASTTALPMLEVAELVQLVDVRVDAETIRLEHLHARPSPDVLLAACGELGVDPAEAVSLTHSGAGIVACRAAGIPAIGIATGAEAVRLTDFGADRVVPSLSALLAPALRTAA